MSVEPVWQPLPGDLQARYEPATGVLYLDPEKVPADGVAQVVSEIEHELLGNHHLAPHVDRGPLLRIVVGGVAPGPGRGVG